MSLNQAKSSNVLYTSFYHLGITVSAPTLLPDMMLNVRRVYVSKNLMILAFLIILIMNHVNEYYIH